ncbi:hypothetical protein JO379_003663 [Streptomyces syringium]|uniref:Uncharacterized protein n=1 Tax=Streptomyces syringium TaxID=76729 RepID=A0ABS4Y621_9ACTN|nr:hypothetical protein [Streptomyces syringium]
MEELGTEKVLMDERMGHIDGSVSARHSHVTQAMRDLWETIPRSSPGFSQGLPETDQGPDSR